MKPRTITLSRDQFMAGVLTELGKRYPADEQELEVVRAILRYWNSLVDHEGWVSQPENWEQFE